MKVVQADCKEGQRSVVQYLVYENPERQVLLLRHGSQLVTESSTFLVALAKLRKVTISFFMSVCPYGISRLPLDGFS